MLGNSVLLTFACNNFARQNEKCRLVIEAPDNEL